MATYETARKGLLVSQINMATRANKQQKQQIVLNRKSWLNPAFYIPALTLKCYKALFLVSK